MSKIQNTPLVGGQLLPVGPRATAPVVDGVQAPEVGADALGTGLDGVSASIARAYRRLGAAQRAGDPEAARAAFQDLKRFAAIGQQYAAGTPYAEKFARVNGAVQTASAQYEAAIARDPAQHPPAPAPGAEGQKQTIMVGLPGRGGRMVEVETHKAEHKGPFGLLGKLVDKAGGALEGIGHVVFMPLELAGKVLDPVRHGVGSMLSGLRHGIDNTLGKIPVIGSAVRFTTGLLNSAVGLVDGALQGVTHPVELIKGLGSMAYTITSMVPPVMFARMAWDAAVNGKTPMESLKDTYGEAGAIAKGFFANALEDIKQGNYAGALGQVTGDIGSFFVTGGAAGGAKVAGTGSRLAKLAEAAKATELGGKVAKAAEVAKLDRAAALGAKVLGTGVEASGKIFTLGLKGNFAAWNRLGKAVSGLPGMQRLIPLSEQAAGKLRARSAAKLESSSRADLQARVEKLNAEHKPFEVRMWSNTNRRVETWQLLGHDANGKLLIRRGDGATKSVSYRDLQSYNPAMRQADLWAAEGRVENPVDFANMYGASAKSRGMAINVPSSSGEGFWKHGTLFGHTADGKLVVERPDVYDHQGTLVQRGAANLVGYDRILAANPELVVGKRLGTLDGHQLYVQSFDAARQEFRLAFPATDGKWYDAGALTPEQLSGKLRSAGVLSYTPKAKLGIDGQGHLLSDPTLGIGNGGVDRARAEVIQAWWYRDAGVQNRAIEAIATNPRAAEAIRGWHRLSPEQRVQMANYVAYEQGRIYGFKPARVETVPEFPGHPNQLGVFEPDAGVMKVRADQLANPAKFLNTVFHEQLHAYQWENVKKFRAGQMAETDPMYHISREWSENWENYRTTGNAGYEDYFSQPLEAHAFNGGNAFERAVWNLLKPQDVAGRVAAAVGG